eukprot:8522141-Pyramimonas_sp.AAC.1
MGGGRTASMRPELECASARSAIQRPCCAALRTTAEEAPVKTLAERRAGRRLFQATDPCYRQRAAVR